MNTFNTAKTAKNTTEVKTSTVCNAATITNLIKQAHCSNAYLADKAIVALINAYEGMMKAAVNAAHVPNNLFDDYMTEAKYGLLKAIRDYDDTKGVAFSLYAKVRINFALISAIERDSPLHIPHHTFAHMSKVAKAIRCYEQQYHDKPTAAELTELTGLTSSQVVKAMIAMKSQYTSSIDAEIGIPVDADYEAEEIVFAYDRAVETESEGLAAFDNMQIANFLVRTCKVLCNDSNAKFLAEDLRLQNEGLTREEICNKMGLSKGTYDKKKNRIVHRLIENRENIKHLYANAA